MKISEFIHHPAKLIHKFDAVAEAFLAIFSVVSLLLMVSLIGVGLWKMSLSIPRFFGGHGKVEEFLGAPSVGESGVASALEGLECIFLAPLAFLLVSGIWDFVEAVVRARRKDRPLSSIPPTFLNRVKELIIGLMIAVVATDLLKRSVAEHGLSYQLAITGCLFIAVLAVYSFLLERSSATKTKSSEGDDSDLT